MDFLPEHFDPWSESYDHEVAAETGFPFTGYSELLKAMIEIASLKPGNLVLDLGCGTGNLSAAFRNLGCRVYGTDFSSKMITKARDKFPSLQFAVADVRDPLPPEFPKTYDLIVSAYVFHHFPIEEKIKQLQQYAKNHLNPGGKIIIGDLMFSSEAALQEAKLKYADTWDDEYYWILDQDLSLLRQAGLNVEVRLISFCAALIWFGL